MEFRYETDRLILQVGNESMAAKVAGYLVKNRSDFSKWDMELGDSYYTEEYQKNALQAELQLLLRREGVRFYIMLREKPDIIIGNVSFAYLMADCGHRCSIGYKIDADERQKGIAYEATSFLLPIVVNEFDLKRIEADILPENRPSLALIKKLGFEYEGIARKAHEVAGVDRDHLRFAYIPR